MRAEKPPSQLGLEDEVFGSGGRVFAHLPQPVARLASKSWGQEGWGRLADRGTDTEDRHEGGGRDCTETGREREIGGERRKQRETENMVEGWRDKGRQRERQQTSQRRKAEDRDGERVKIAQH